MRQKVMVPTKGSSMILNASSANGSLSFGRRQTFVPSFFAPLFGGAVARRGKIVHDGVEQRLHALVLEGRAAQHRKERAGQHGLADQPLQRRLIGLLAVEIGGEHVVVEYDRGFQ